MDIGSILLAILDNSAITALLGVAVGYLFESRRRTQERRERQVERERDAISDVQLGLVGMLHGGEAASSMFDLMEGFAAKSTARGTSFGMLEAMESFNSMLGSTWIQDWTAASQRVSVNLVRISDSELQTLAAECVRISDSMHPGDTTTELEARYHELKKATEAANERAGQFYRELDNRLAQSWYHRVWPWLRSTITQVRNRFRTWRGNPG